MKHFALFLAGYTLLAGCRSSYDESRQKPEVGSASSNPKIDSPSVPQVEGPTTPVTQTPSTPAKPSSGGQSAGSTQAPSQSGKDGVVLPTEDPAVIAMQHNASDVELKKYNCKGTAVITDSGMDDNKDGKLSDDEILETRIDCTEVVPGGG